jgi:hypothetical protein
MSLVDRWLSSPRGSRAATIATSATLTQEPSVSANFSVATDLRHAATRPRALAPSPPLSQSVARDLRHEKPQNSAPIEAVSQLSQMSQGAADVACSDAEDERAEIVEQDSGASELSDIEGEHATDAGWWRDQYEERVAIRQYGGGYPRVDAELLAWHETENRWNVTHGERVPRDLCAGCRRPIGTAETLDLIDGNRVHDRPGHACLNRHGARRRSAARRALVVLGLEPPDGAG